MDHNEFVVNAIRTESVVEKLGVDHALLLSALALYIETTEILDVIKKTAFYGNTTKMDTLPELLNRVRNNLDDMNYLVTNLQSQNFMPEYPEAVNTRIAHGIIGICTEGGELAQCLVEALRGGEMDVINVIEELFDGDWYKAIITDELDVDWSKGWEVIINKLRSRYGEKFSNERATVRDLKAEREILESGNT